MKIIYEHLSQQTFPQLGNCINIITGMKRYRSKSAEFQTISVSAPPPISQYPVFKFLTDSMQRRNSTFVRLLKFPESTENENVWNKAKINDRWITKRIKRPIDFRFSGSRQIPGNRVSVFRVAMNLRVLWIFFTHFIDD